MKLLSIAIPCYNSEKYMRKCIDSLLVGGEDVEILIVDDGSTKDRTAEIAEEANYNMIDGLKNNTPKKKDKNAPRRSELKRLRKHQQKIASQGKGQPQQQRAVEEEMERKKK